MDGFEACTKIRALLPAKKLRIIAMTAHALPGDRQRCTDVGMDDYIAKPVVMDTLREKLVTWLSSELLDALSDNLDAVFDADNILLPFLYQLHQKVGKAAYRVLEIYLDDQEDMVSVVEKRVILKQARQLVTQQSCVLDDDEQRYVAVPENVMKMEAGIRHWCDQQAAFLEDLVTTTADHTCEKPEPQVINPQTQRILKENLEETYAHTLSIFIHDAPVRITEIAKALADGDLIRVKRAAHSLKGGCHYLGAEQMAAQCLLLEETAELGHQDESQQLLSSIQASFEPVKVVLKREMGLNTQLD